MGQLYLFVAHGDGGSYLIQSLPCLFTLLTSTILHIYDFLGFLFLLMNVQCHE